jgi:hypothetical protein
MLNKTTLEASDLTGHVCPDRSIDVIDKSIEA